MFKNKHSAKETRDFVLSTKKQNPMLRDFQG